MAVRDRRRVLHPSAALLIGTVVFVAVSTAVDYFLDLGGQTLLALVLHGAISLPLLGLALDFLGDRFYHSIFVGGVGYPVCFLVTFLAAHYVGYVGMVFFNAVFGALAGSVLFGRRRAVLFAFVAGVISIPFWSVIAFNSFQWELGSDWLEPVASRLHFLDLNFQLMSASVGAGIGLAVGLLRYSLQRRPSR